MASIYLLQIMIEYMKAQIQKFGSMKLIEMKVMAQIINLLIMIIICAIMHIFQIKTLSTFQSWNKWVDFHITLAFQEAFIQNNYSSFGVKLLYEYNPSCPITYEEYTDKISQIDLSLIIGNERFDPSNIEEPVQRLTTDQHFSSFTPKLHNYYTMFIGMNTYEIESGVFSSEKTGKFYSVTRENSYTTDILNSPK